MHAKPYKHDEKAQLWEKLIELTKEINERTQRQDIKLDSYIVSATAFNNLSEHYDDGTWNLDKFAENHILFQERKNEYDYIEKILLAN